MLWGLRRADARVKDFIASYAVWVGLPPRPVLMECDGNDRDAALSLALSLRMLASIIVEMIARLRRRQLLFLGQAIAASLLASRPHHSLAATGDSSGSRFGIPDTPDASRKTVPFRHKRLPTEKAPPAIPGIA